MIPPRLAPVNTLLLSIGLLFAAAASGFAGEPVYLKRATREATRTATAQAIDAHFGLAGLQQAPWQFVGPFDNQRGSGINRAFPPEDNLNLQAEYLGTGGLKLRWQDGARFTDNQINDLRVFQQNEWAVVYLTREIESDRDVTATLFAGSEDTLRVWINGKQVYDWQAGRRSTKPDDDKISVPLKQGKNRLLMKICNTFGGFGFYYRLTTLSPDEDAQRQHMLARMEERLDVDFPKGESAYYRIESVAIPANVVLEAGGIAFAPDGRLFVCTRRGEIWSLNPANNEWKLFASGLHEALGILAVSSTEFIVAQRPELTRVKDTDGDGVADTFEVVANQFGVSGNYHEYHYGPVRDREGNLYGTLNCGWDRFAISSVPLRGWAYKITAAGEFIPYALGLRSPSGIGISPGGDIFITDNQGDWLGTSPLLHLAQGAFYGHPASLKWVRSYNGPPNPHAIPANQLVPLKKRPAALFVYGPLGQAPGEPVWDTTGGKFGPFGGQMFVPDLTKSIVARSALEKVGGEFQGAIFPFRAGFASGTFRAAFDQAGALWLGMTDRGWGSTGAKSYALQKLVWSGQVPMEILTMKLTATGFDLTFTKPVDAKTAANPRSYSFTHYHYLYHFDYGSPKQAETAVPVKEVKISADRKTVSLVLPELVIQKVYELHLSGLKAEDGADLLHPDAYYTLERLLNTK